MLHTALFPWEFSWFGIPLQGASICLWFLQGRCVFFLHQDREYTFKTETNQGLTVFLGHRCWQFLSSRPKPSCTLPQCGNITDHLPSRDMEVTLRWDSPTSFVDISFRLCFKDIQWNFRFFCHSCANSHETHGWNCPIRNLPSRLDSITPWALFHHFWDLPEVNERQSVETFQGSFPVRWLFRRRNWKFHAEILGDSLLVQSIGCLAFEDFQWQLALISDDSLTRIFKKLEVHHCTKAFSLNVRNQKSERIRWNKVGINSNTGCTAKVDFRQYFGN